MAIVSFSRKFIFIKTRKTAGTSVQESLLPCCAAGDVATMVWTNVLGGERSPIQEFASLAEIEHEYSLNRGDFFSFGFTRNPFALVLSRYFYQIKQGRLVEEPSRDNFNRWLKQVYFSGEPGFPGGRYLKDRSRLLLFDEKLQQQVDYIGKVERLEADFKHVLGRAGLPGDTRLLHVNDSNRGRAHYREWIDADSRGMIEAHFDFELDFFGYSFGA